MRGLIALLFGFPELLAAQNPIAVKFIASGASYDYAV